MTERGRFTFGVTSTLNSLDAVAAVLATWLEKASSSRGAPSGLHLDKP
jgi:hypothetical protein